MTDRYRRLTKGIRAAPDESWSVQVTNKISADILDAMYAESHEVHDLGVFKTHRRGGFGRRLLKESIAITIPQDHSLMLTNTTDGSSDAMVRQTRSLRAA
jgi:hypothetical protein